MFEATACGALLITKRVSNIDELWRLGKEIIVYDDAKELPKLINYYLENDKERVKIAKAGQKRTLKEHKYSDRVKLIKDYIYGSSKK